MKKTRSRKSRDTVPLRLAMGVRNQVGVGLSYRPTSLCSLVTQFQTRFLGSILRPIVRLNFPTPKQFWKSVLKDTLDCFLFVNYAVEFKNFSMWILA
jgi:hypothetical protein